MMLNSQNEKHKRWCYIMSHLSAWQRLNNSTLCQKYRLVQDVEGNLCLSKPQMHMFFNPAIPLIGI